MLLGLGAVRAEPPGRTVVAAAHDLPSGTELTPDDLRRVRLPVSAVPGHSTTRIDDVVGRTVAGPMRAGEVVTDRRVVDPGRMSGFPDGSVLATIRLADAEALTNLRVGDLVNVLAVDPDSAQAEVVAKAAVIVTLPSTRGDSSGVALGVATDEQTALTLAERALDARLTVLTAGRYSRN